MILASARVVRFLLVDILLVPDPESLGLPELRAYGVSLVDFDEDGRPDVTIAAKEGVYLLRNEGDWNFADVTQSMGLRAPALANRVDQAHAVIWVDVDDDGDLWLDCQDCNDRRHRLGRRRGR